MSELDVMNVNSLSQDLTHSGSPLCMETSSTTSDLPQNEIKNVKRENESQSTLSEEIYNALDNLLGDINIRNYSQKVLIQPIDASISSMRQFEPICKFHWTEFNSEMTIFHNPTEGSSYTEKPELRGHLYNYAQEEDSFKEENPMRTSISTNQNRLANAYVRPPPRSPPVTPGSGETLSYSENSLAESTARESALHPNQPQSFLYEESIQRSGRKPFYTENSFSPLDLRVNYTTEETAVSSYEILNSGEISEMSVSHPKEVTEVGTDSPEAVSAWSPAGISWTSSMFRENCGTPGTEHSFESFQSPDEDMALNDILRKLKHTNRKQQTQIQDLQCTNLYLEEKVKELQMKMTKQQGLVKIINKLKENVEDLIEDKYTIMLEKNGINKTLQNSQEVLANTQKRLQESKKEKGNLQLELKKIKINYVRLQKRCISAIRQKNRSVSYCIEMDKTLSKKEEEVARLQRLKEELEKATTSALDLLKRERKVQEQEFQKYEKNNLEETQKLKSRLEKLVVQVNNLQSMYENERAKNAKLQQQINEVKNENAKLQQQSRSEEQTPNVEMAQLKEQLEEVMESDVTKDTKMIHSNLFLSCPPCEEENPNPPDMKRTSQLASKFHTLLALMIGLLTCQDINNPDAEHFKENEKVSDIMLQKLKSFHLQKKNLDEELLKHKERIATFRKLIASEKAGQEPILEVTDFDSSEVKNVENVPILLGDKLDKYHSLNEELDFLISKLGNLLESEDDHCNKLIEENDSYQRHVGNLINKVTSYEEIIECANQRLEISHSEIAHLEDRNRHLEDLIRKPRERVRKPRPRRLESHPKSLTVMPDT
ncbi:cancer-associated gene 1 protein isoform X2 [Tupaia chinensis]|uniref:cancer-associated gene 1 protein isoform X2 n=1 Tax=Tupaia chinensis TaxID=246437 RepID=UPI0003C8CB13|nr:cancer-associated gene 1 protein isoform X2 [Tupaia chinensis]